MKALFALWILAALVHQVVPNAVGRFPRQAANASSYLHTEYEAKIEQKGKHGNESFGTMSGQQAIEHDNCNDNWNAFANKCAALIKDLVASLANAVSSKPGDTTNLQLQIKNTFRHFDNTHNCSCFNQTGNELSDMDLSHLLDNLTLSTTAPDDGDGGKPKTLTPGTNPEHEVDPDSTSNSRRQAHHPIKPSNIVVAPDAHQGHSPTSQPSSECSDCKSEQTTTPPLYVTHKNSPLESSSSVKSSHPDGSGHSPKSQAPVEIKPAVVVTPANNGQTGDSPGAATSVPVIISTDATPGNNQPKSDTPGHVTNTGPLGTTDAHSHNAPDDNAAAPVHSNHPTIPLTNSHSNIPESSDPISSDKSLSSGQSPSAPNSSPVAVIPQGTTPDCENSTPPCDDTSDAGTVTIPVVASTDAPEIHITPKPATGSPGVANQEAAIPVVSTPHPTQVPVAAVVPQDTEGTRGKDDDDDDDNNDDSGDPVAPVVATGTTENCDDDDHNGGSGVTAVPVVATGTTEKCDDDNSDDSGVTVVPVVATVTTEKCDDDNSDDPGVTVVPVVATVTTGKDDDDNNDDSGAAVPVVSTGTTEKCDDDDSNGGSGVTAVPVVVTGTTDKCDDDNNNDGSGVTVVPVVVSGTTGKDDDDNDDSGAAAVPVVATGTTEKCDDDNNDGSGVTAVPVVVTGTTEKCDDDNNDGSGVTAVPVVVTGTTEKCDDDNNNDSGAAAVPVVATGSTEKDDDDDNNDDSGAPVVPALPTGTTEKCDDDNNNDGSGVTVVPVVASGTTGKDDDDNDDSGAAAVPVVATGTTEKCDDDNSEPSAVTVVPVVATTEQCDDDNNEHATVAVVPVEPSGEGQNHQGSPVGDDTTEIPVKTDDHTEVSESPVLVQPTTFQTTSEEPTHSPVSTQPPILLVPVSTASTPQDSGEGNTLGGTHHNHDDDDDDDDDDCCSCEACTEEDNSDPQKVRENVCKSLEEARKELKSIFDKIKKKLRCCRKMPSTISTNTSPLPQ